MGNFNQSIKKFIKAYGVSLGLVIGFSAGILAQSTGLMAKLSGTSMSASIAGVIPGTNETTAVNAVVCGLTQMPANDERRGMIVRVQDYDAASLAFQQAHPNEPAGAATWGGVIGKEYLMAIINSLPASQTNIRYCFATEANQKTSLYFKGGTLDPVSGKATTNTVVVKTGSSVDAYCPTHCQD